MLSLHNIIFSAIFLFFYLFTLTSSQCHIIIIMSVTSWIFFIVFAVQSISATTSVSVMLLRIKIAIIVRYFKIYATQFNRKFLVILWYINSNRFLHSLIIKLITCMYLLIILLLWQSIMFINLSFSIILIVYRYYLLSISSFTLFILWDITVIIVSLQRFIICCCL